MPLTLIGVLSATRRRCNAVAQIVGQPFGFSAKKKTALATGTVSINPDKDAFLGTSDQLPYEPDSESRSVFGTPAISPHVSAPKNLSQYRVQVQQSGDSPTPH